MKEVHSYKERVKYLLLGFGAAIVILSLLGANNFREETVLLDNNRYRIAAWGDDRSHGAFIMDNITGQTKIVYRHQVEELNAKEVENVETIEESESLDRTENLEEMKETEIDFLNLPFTKIP